ncbi:outer membrane protein assembly factor BamD [Marinilabiliaceae bacterium ANBcel2]|nr:outer membrane protein assembly factor BamD [Marinilabiliaceae bacterium ANBcel2]
MRNSLLFVVFLLLFASCSEYQKLLKSDDTELQYEAALNYYQEGDYTRAARLFEGLIGRFRGTERAEMSHYIYADCLFENGDYLNAGYYFDLFTQNYPTSDLVEDAQFMTAYSSYKMSPNPRLDQTDTYNAIDGFQLFINLYPNSERAEEAADLMQEMRDKLAYKAYLNCRLYYEMGTYMGNNYQSAVITARNTLEDFPDTKYSEELAFLILDSKYIQAMKSVEERQQERLRETVDEYYAFINQYPESQYMNEAHNIFEEASSMLN